MSQSPNLGGSRFHNYALYSITAAAAIGYGFILTLFGEFEKEFNISESRLGLIAAIGFLSGFLAQIGLARYADRGYSSLMIKLGMLISVFAAFGMIFSDSFWQFFIGRFALGLGAALITPAVRRIVISKSAENVGANLGFLASVELGGFTLGPVFSAVLADVFNIRAPFIALTIIYGIFFVISTLVKVSSDAAPTTSSKRVLRDLIKIPGVQAGVWMIVALFATIGAFEASWALYLEDKGAPTWLIGVGISLFGLPLIFLAPFGGRIAQRRGPIRVMTYSVLAAAACTVSYGFLPWVALLLIVSFIHGTFDAITYPATQVAVAMSSPKESIAAGQGLLSAVGLFVAGTMAGIGGAFYEWGGPKLLYASTTAIMLVVVVLARWSQARQV